MHYLDKWLGKETLNHRIDELEEARASLKAQLDAERRRRSDAVRDRQEAQERANSLEDRIAGLEGELNRLREREDQGVSWSRVETISQRGIHSVLDTLESVRTDPETALSAVINEGLPEPVQQKFGDHALLVENIAPCLVLLDDIGLVRVVFDPPRVPEAFVRWDDRFEIDRGWFTPTERERFALVRADLFSLGTYADGELTHDVGFESPVMGKHSKGGFSQARFERRRSEQVDEHVKRCEEALVDLEDPLTIVGDRRIVSSVADYADQTGISDASGKPESALHDAFRDFWTTRMYLP